MGWFWQTSTMDIQILSWSPLYVKWMCNGWDSHFNTWFQLETNPPLFIGPFQGAKQLPPSFLSFFPPISFSRKVCRVLIDKNQSGPQMGSVMTASSFYLQWLWGRQSMVLLLLASWYTCQTISGLSQREMGRLWVRYTWNMCRKYRLSSHTKKWIQNRLNTFSTEVLLFIAWWK